MTVSVPEAAGVSADSAATAPGLDVSFREALLVWARIGFMSFGGPAGQIALMHRIFVEEKRWIGESRFLHALNYCMLLPGPEAQQLATYVGWLLHRTLGGLVAGVLFILPGAVVILALSILYAGFHDLSLVKALFFGIKAAVLAVVIEAVLRIGRRTLKNRVMYGIAAASFVAIFFFGAPFPAIVVAAGLIGFVGARLRPDQFSGQAGHEARAAQVAGRLDSALDGRDLPHTRPSIRRMATVIAICLTLWFTPIIVLGVLLGPAHVYVQEGLFFSKMAVVTFGGAYAVLAYVAQQAVETHGWLAPGEMLDGLGMAETTPGPLIMVVQFVGFMGAYRNPGALDPILAGALGAMLTTWVTFVPCFLWIFLGAPYVEMLRGSQALGAALSAITAAVVGVILNLAVWFGLHVAFGQVNEHQFAGVRLFWPAWETVNPASLTLTVAALIAMLRFGIGVLPTLTAAAGLGALYSYAVL